MKTLQCQHLLKGHDGNLAGCGQPLIVLKVCIVPHWILNEPKVEIFGHRDKSIRLFRIQAPMKFHAEQHLGTNISSDRLENPRPFRHVTAAPVDI